MATLSMLHDASFILISIVTYFRKPLDPVTADRTRAEARSAVMSSIPEVLVNLVGQQAALAGTAKVFDTLQNQTLNKQLFYDILETAVYDVFPELAESNAAMKFKKFTV